MTALAVVGGVAGMSAFEAHVINVTAKIENALNVPVDQVKFGTVFPQEALDKRFDISLSASFIEEDRVDDVDYLIRQKPKCAITSDNGTVLDESATKTGHVIPLEPGKVDINAAGLVELQTLPGIGPVLAQRIIDYREANGPFQSIEEIKNVSGIGDATFEAIKDLITVGGAIDCGEPPRPLTSGETWEPLPLLCPYLSKHKAEGDQGEPDEAEVDAFHQPWEISGGQIRWTEAKGHLSKLAQDLSDQWVLDLKVPCFGGHCAQDWAKFVTDINPDVVDPDVFVQPIENEEKVFGCDLWIEVFGISLPGFGCEEELDMMLVLDRSGSIDSPELATLKTAASAFVEALMPADTGNDVHIGQSSFADTGSLDEHLTDVKADVLAAISGLSSGGVTNLKEGIELATGELDDTDAHERPTVADVMVIITDGNPNVPPGPPISDIAAARAAAATAADAARAAGIEVFVVGVGSDVDATYLTNEIADPAPPTHYFDVADFEALEDLLVGLTECPA